MSPSSSPIFYRLRGLAAALCTLFAVGSSSAADTHGQTQIGEGSELVVSKGWVVREVPSDREEFQPSLAVGTTQGQHYLYDPNKLVMQGVWTGLFGRVTEEGSFAPELGRLKSFALKRTPPWSFGETPRCVLEFDWHGYEIRDDHVVFRYRLFDEPSGMSWEVEESLEYVSEELQRIHFAIEPNQETSDYLNYWVRQTEFRRLSANGQQIQRNLLKNLYPNQKDFTLSFLRRRETPTVPHGYSISPIEIPTPELPARFEPTDMDFAPDGSVFVTTRTGGVWRLQDGNWSLFADGLNEVNGVRMAPDADGIFVMQRPELTRLRDTDGDGAVDHYETMADRFRFTGHYHEFAFGPRINSAGQMFFSTGLASSGFFTATDNSQNQMTTALGYRGWVMRYNPDGTLTPFAAGLRSPAGIGINAEDELFIVDNQGDWVASSYLGHVEEGDFLGHPVSLWDRPEFGITPSDLDYRTLDAIPEDVPPLDKAAFTRERKLPSVWLSHGDLTNSPGHPSFAPEKVFGPFGGQAFIADIAHRNIVRVALEKVGGKYQGAVFPFIRPLSSASYSTAFDPDGNLWVGAVGRGWTAGEPMIEVIHFDEEETPFEMHRIALTRDGFDIHFTQPLASRDLELQDLAISEYQYEYWSGYGSEQINTAEVPIASATVSTDRRVLSIKLPRQAEYIYEIQLPELTSASGLSLENNYAVYTLNQLLP